MTNQGLCIAGLRPWTRFWWNEDSTEAELKPLSTAHTPTAPLSVAYLKESNVAGRAIPHLVQCKDFGSVRAGVRV